MYAAKPNQSKDQKKLLRFSPTSHQSSSALLQELCSLLLVLMLGGCPAESDGPPLGDTVSGALCAGAPKPRAPIKPSMLGGFPTCCDGSARMVPAMLIPADFAAMLMENPDDKKVCVPELYATQPDYTPTKCKSLFGLPGACISSCVSQVGKAPIPMPKDICQGNELCAPCMDPRTRKESGACSMGELACDPSLHGQGECRDWEPTLDLNQFQPCCQASKGKAHCADKSLVPGDLVNMLEPCATGVCVPDTLLARGGGYTPKKCKSIGGREGRCTSVCVPAVSKDMAMLPVDVCEQDERCAPCFDPRTGQDTKACNVGLCDQGPTEGNRPFQNCGVGGADTDWCVPASLVPEAMRANFDNKGCLDAPCKGADEICVPTPIILQYPNLNLPKCEVSGMALIMGEQFKDGRCASKCMKKVADNAWALSQSTCGQNEICTPCLDPLNNAVPTGICGLPTTP